MCTAEHCNTTELDRIRVGVQYKDTDFSLDTENIYFHAEYIVTFAMNEQFSNIHIIQIIL